MATLTHNQYRLVVHDLLDHRVGFLRRLAGGAPFEAALRSLGAELDAFAARDPDGVDDALLDLVQAHLEAAIPLYHIVEGYARDPFASDEQRAAAARLRRTVVDGQRGARISASRRFEHAHRLHERRAALDADLALFPAAPGAPSLAERVDAWIRLGLDIGAVLSARTVREDAVRMRDARTLRGAAASLLASLRTTIRTECRLDPRLPDNLEAQILGFADTLLPGRRRPAAETPPPATDAPATPVA
jgi:hypothetical protein